MRKLALALVAAAASAALGEGGPAPAQLAASSGPRPAAASFAAYVAAFNAESPANQLALGGAAQWSAVSRGTALKQVLRQDPKATVLESGLGVFREAYNRYKPVPVWVFAVDPGGPHISANFGPSGNHAILKYNCDVIIASARTGAVIEEAQGWDKKLPPLPPGPAK